MRRIGRLCEYKSTDNYVCGIENMDIVNGDICVQKDEIRLHRHFKNNSFMPIFNTILCLLILPIKLIIMVIVEGILYNSIM